MVFFVRDVRERKGGDAKEHQRRQLVSLPCQTACLTISTLYHADCSRTLSLLVRQRSREYLTLSALDPAAHGRREIRRDVVWRYAKRFSSKIVSPLRDESREPTACPSPRNSRKRERNEGTGTRCRVLIRNSILRARNFASKEISNGYLSPLPNVCVSGARGRFAAYRVAFTFISHVLLLLLSRRRSLRSLKIPPSRGK